MTRYSYPSNNTISIESTKKIRSIRLLKNHFIDSIVWIGIYLHFRRRWKTAVHWWNARNREVTFSPRLVPPHASGMLYKPTIIQHCRRYSHPAYIHRRSAEKRRNESVRKHVDHSDPSQSKKFLPEHLCQAWSNHCTDQPGIWIASGIHHLCPTNSEFQCRLCYNRSLLNLCQRNKIRCSIFKLKF